MRPPARLQAAIDILDAVIAAARSNGAAADTLIQRYFRTRRYAGSSDRAAIRDLVYAGIRFAAEPPLSGRALMLGLAATRPEMLALFDGSAHAPAPPAADEPRSKPSLYPRWLRAELTARFPHGFDAELQALIARAPVDLRVNPERAQRADVAEALGATPIAGLANGLRLAEAQALQAHPLLLDGSIELQDAGSQLVTAVAAARPGETVIDLCAGAGGKTLALAADMQGRGRLIATDSNRARLRAMAPRLQRAGAAQFVEQRLLDPGRELQALDDLRGQADLVVVDAPCSGSGTWRRNPELRWRLDAKGLAQLRATQARLLGIGAQLLKPSGRLIYAVCSVLPSEGRAQVQAARHIGLTADRRFELSPASTHTDGFFIARFCKIC